MGLASDIADSITGNLATDALKALGRRTARLAFAEQIGRLLNPDRLHTETLQLLESALNEAFGSCEEVDPLIWRPILEHPENRVQMIAWVLSWQEEVDPLLEEWSLENAPNPDQLRALLKNVHTIIQKRKREVFAPEFFNQLGILSVITQTMDSHSQRFNEVVELIQRVLSQTEPLKIDRAIEIEQRFQRSIALSAARWMALGVPAELAQHFANDLTKGFTPPELMPSPEQPLRILVGEIGTGKSLICERFFQRALDSASADITLPIPVFLPAGDILGSLQEAVFSKPVSTSATDHRGTVIVIDDAHVLDPSKLWRLLEEARALVRYVPGTRVLIATRPARLFDGAPESVSPTDLAKPAAEALVREIAGDAFVQWSSNGLPTSLELSISRPLFAILLGVRLSTGESGLPQSKAELLADLLGRAFAKEDQYEPKIQATFRRLARLSLARNGGLVPANEVASGSDLDLLRPSGLVVTSRGAIGFALPLFTEWFAAKALARNEVPVEEWLEPSTTRERWRPVLSIGCATLGSDQISSLLAPLAQRDPAFTAEVIEEGVANWGIAEDVAAPPALECARQVRSATGSFVQGIGVLASLIAPLRRDGTLRALGVATHNAWLQMSWYMGQEDVSDEHLMPMGVSDQRWPSIRMARPGRQSAWAWRWTLEELSGRLAEKLNAGDFPVPPVLAYEGLWNLACHAARKGPSLFSNPISLLEVWAAISSTSLLETLPLEWRPCLDPFHQFREEVRRRLDSGERVLHPPWPGPDRSTDAGWIWSGYSSERIRDRAGAIYRAAISGYQALVTTWFPAFAPRLTREVTLPARLLGVISQKVDPYGEASQPWMRWILVPLPPGSVSDVDLRLDHHPDVEKYSRTFMDKLWNQLARARPAAAGWIEARLEDGAMDIFRSRPATWLAYRWLWQDLERTGWIKGTFSGPH